MLAAVALGLFLAITGQAKAEYIFTTLDAPGARFGTDAFGINDAGQIVGCFTDAGFTLHGFLLSSV
jgi:hypothetical protein